MLPVGGCWESGIAKTVLITVEKTPWQTVWPKQFLKWPAALAEKHCGTDCRESAACVRSPGPTARDGSEKLRSTSCRQSCLQVHSACTSQQVPVPQPQLLLALLHAHSAGALPRLLFSIFIFSDGFTVSYLLNFVSNKISHCVSSRQFHEIKCISMLCRSYHCLGSRKLTSALQPLSSHPSFLPARPHRVQILEDLGFFFHTFTF